MGEWNNYERAFVAIGVFLLVLAGLITFNGEDDELTSYALGAAFGSVALGFILGALVRWLWVKHGDGSPPVTDPPAWLLVAGIVGVALASGRFVLDDGAGGSAQACVKPEAGQVAGGMTLTPTPDAVDQQVQAMLASAPGGYGAMFEDVNQFIVVGEGQRGMGVLISMPIKGGISSEDRDDFMRGASAGVSEQGAVPENHEVAGLSAVGAQLPQGYILMTTDGCGALQSAAQTSGEAKAILENVIRD